MAMFRFSEDSGLVVQSEVGFGKVWLGLVWLGPVW